MALETTAGESRIGVQQSSNQRRRVVCYPAEKESSNQWERTWFGGYARATKRLLRRIMIMMIMMRWNGASMRSQEGHFSVYFKQTKAPIAFIECRSLPTLNWFLSCLGLLSSFLSPIWKVATFRCKTREYRRQTKHSTISVWTLNGCPPLPSPIWLITIRPRTINLVVSLEVEC